MNTTNSNNAIDFAVEHADEIRCELARRKFDRFALAVIPNLTITPFHAVYYHVLDLFAHGKIRKLIVSAPCQHGKSQASTRMLPAYLLGINPDLKIAIGSYSQQIARDFNRDVQKIIDSEDYQRVFPSTKLAGMINDDAKYMRNTDLFEVVNRQGSLRVVGRGGGLTGRTVDISILDDVYKDYAEANSSIVRELAWKWYSTVVRTRLHNESQELIVFTRWHEDDIIGRLEKSGEKIVDLRSWSDIGNIEQDTWVRINFEAIKTTEPTEFDTREIGEPLWGERHSLRKLMAQRSLDPVQFECLYQGNPSSAEGRLYQPFKVYTDKSEYGTFVRKGCMVDTADKGTDLLCAICYDIYRSENMAFNEQTNRFEPILFALVTDIEFTDEGTEVTQVTVPAMVNRNGSQKVFVESNSGGSQFAKAISPKMKAMVEPYFQQSNKESKIITNSANVNNSLIFPLGWETRYEKFYKQVNGFLRNFSSNTHDDAPDCMTEIYLKEIAPNNVKPYGHGRRGVRRLN